MLKRVITLIFFAFASTLTLLLFQNTTALVTPEIIPLAHDSVNAPALWQDPINPHLFWGRKHFHTPNNPGEDPNDESTWKFWGLALYRLDVTNTKINFIRYVSPPNITTRISSRLNNNALVLHSAFDPSIMDYNGTKYIAFECHGINFQGSSNSCIGEVGSDGRLIPERTRVIVKGLNFNEDKDEFHSSGSVPKLLKWKGRVYLSWSAVRQNRSLSDIASFQSITTRGMEIVLGRDGMWHPADTAGSSAEHDPAYSNGPNTTELLGRANGQATADLFSLFPIDDRHLISTAAVGRCTRPIPCYNFSIRHRESAPENILSARAINTHPPLILANLPPNTHEYIRPIRTSDGRLALLGKYLNNPNAPESAVSRVPAGMYLIRHPALTNLYPQAPESMSNLENFTHRLYQELLESHPTEDGIAFIRNLAREGHSYSSIIEAFAEEHLESIQTLATTSAEQVHRIYWSALGRGPESAQKVNQYTAAINRNGFRSVLSGVAESREAQLKCTSQGSIETENIKTWRNFRKNPNRLITRLYEESIGRTPSNTEILEWRGRVTRSNMSCSQLLSNVLMSREFFERQVPTLNPRATIQRLYWSMLGRCPSSGEINDQKATWDRQQGYRSVLHVISNSDEARKLCSQEGLQQ